MPSLADLQRAWLLRQLGLTSSLLTEADLQTAMLSNGFSGNGVGSNRAFSIGKYYAAGDANALSVNALVLNALYFMPFEVGKTSRFDRIACEVTTAGGAGALCRLGIYDTGTDGMPNNLVVDAGTIDGNVVAAAELVINQSLNTGLYWLAIVAQVAAASVRSAATAVSPYIGQSVLPTGGTALSSYRLAGVAGALPASAAGATGNAVPPKLYVRAS